MSEMVAQVCDQHPDRFDCPDCLIAYVPRFDEYGLIIHDGGESIVSIAYCPWCGAKLPESKRDRWHDELAAMGIDVLSNPEIPARFQTDEWFTATRGEES